VLRRDVAVGVVLHDMKAVALRQLQHRCALPGVRQ
jgi:hypothetical protein